MQTAAIPARNTQAKFRKKLYVSSSRNNANQLPVVIAHARGNFSEMMSLQVFITLLLTSGLISAVVVHYLTNAREERDFRRKKIEELFLALQEWCVAFLAHHITWPRVMMGEMDYNQALDIHLENPPKSQGKIETVTMLVNLYLPELRPEFEAILKARDDVNTIQGQFRKAYKEIGPHASHRQFVKPFDDRMTQFEQAQQRFNTALFKVAQFTTRMTAIFRR